MFAGAGTRVLVTHGALPIHLPHAVRDEAGALFGGDIPALLTRMLAELDPIVPAGVAVALAPALVGRLAAGAAVLLQIDDGLVVHDELVLIEGLLQFVAKGRPPRCEADADDNEGKPNNAPNCAVDDSEAAPFCKYRSAVGRRRHPNLEDAQVFLGPN